MSDPRIFVDEEPPGGGNAGPWLVVVMAAVVLAATTFVLAGRGPAEDQAVVQLPTPSTSSTSTTTRPSTTATTQPALILQTWVPSFDRSLNLVRFEARTLTVTTWRPASPPTSTNHPIGAVSWADFDAGGNVLGAVSLNTNGQHVLWLGTAELLEPVLISAGSMSAAFHTQAAGAIAIATSDEIGTTVTEYTIDLGDGIEAGRQYELEGDHRLETWSNDGLLLSGAPDGRLVTWLRSDGSTEAWDGLIPPASGAPLLYGLRTSNGFETSTLENMALVEVPVGTVSVSPGASYAVIDAPFNTHLYDRARDVALPLTDGVGFVSDWTGDERWFVYVSDIESYQLGELTRFVFVDTESGSAVSVSIRDSDIAAPHVLAVAP